MLKHLRVHANNSHFLRQFMYIILCFAVNENVTERTHLRRCPISRSKAEADLILIKINVFRSHLQKTAKLLYTVKLASAAGNSVTRSTPWIFNFGHDNGSNDDILLEYDAV